MSPRTPFSDALHAAFDSEILPLLRRLGLESTKTKNVQPGLVVAAASRELSPTRRITATLWCSAATGMNLRFRLDIEAPVGGIGTTQEIGLHAPWIERRGGPPSLGTDALHPTESPERLARAIALIAGVLAANAETIAGAVPELAETVRSAAAEPAWQAAVARARALWESRNVRGEIEDREVPAKVVFVGAGLVTVDAEGVRLTFRFDTSPFDRAQPVAVSGWYTTPASTRVAGVLINGARRWRFDPQGKLIAIDSA